jgi:hypothetical protein
MIKHINLMKTAVKRTLTRLYGVTYIAQKWKLLTPAYSTGTKWARRTMLVLIFGTHF